MQRWTAAIFAILALLMGACGNAPAVDEALLEQASDIPWFDGDVPEAFAAAKAAGKPVFLYWGAVWCPPCHNLKRNTFAQPDFLQSIRSFVPVYLDGDTERAQLWAERYGIAGYPTVILFSPTGTELYRMPSDVTPERYGELLRSVVSRIRPVGRILDDVVASGIGSVDDIDLQLLAFHSWAQDPHIELSKHQQLAAFWTIYNELPADDRRLRARFMTLALDQVTPPVWAAGPPTDDVSGPQLDEAQRVALREGLVHLLGSPELWSDNKIFLTLRSRHAVESLEPAPSPERDELVGAWLTAAARMQRHPEFSTTEQLMAVVPEFELLSLSEGHGAGSIPAELQQNIRSRVDEVVASSSDPAEFQSTLNMLVWLLTMAQLTDEAKALLDRHADDTIAPNYFFSILGDLSEDNPGTAIQWHRLAYENSGQGSARVKWGAAYIEKLTRLTPGDAAAIEAAARHLIGDLVEFPDAFAGRNRLYLEQAEQALGSWAESTNNQSVVERLRDLVRARCAELEAAGDSVQATRCRSFLAAESPF